MERAQFIINHIQPDYDEFEELVADISVIRAREFHGFLGITGWDYIERPTNEIYSPPQAYDWILYGVCVLLFKNDLPSLVEEAIVDYPENGQLYHSVKTKMISLSLTPERFGKMLSWQVADSDGETENLKSELYFKKRFQEKQERVLTYFARVKVLHEEEKKREIVGQPLNREEIQGFIDSLVPKWTDACISMKLFERYGDLNISNERGDLERLGGSVLLEHQKLMFISKGRQHFYGSSDFGAVYGRQVDEFFIHKVLQQGTRLSASMMRMTVN